MWSRSVRNKDWKRQFDRMAMPKTKMKKILTRKASFLENQDIKNQDFITLVFMWSLLGVRFSLIQSYIDVFMCIQKHGKTAKGCFDTTLLLHICQRYAVEKNFMGSHTFFGITVSNTVFDGTTLLNKYQVIELRPFLALATPSIIPAKNAARILVENWGIPKLTLVYWIILKKPKLCFELFPEKTASIFFRKKYF